MAMTFEEELNNFLLIEAKKKKNPDGKHENAEWSDKPAECL